LIATLEILGYAAGGSCVARHEGRVIFVRGVLPGELVKVDISEQTQSKRYANATLIEIIKPSPIRVNAPCKYFGQCGGCDWQHLSLENQKKMHLQTMSDQLQRIGKYSDLIILPVMTVPNESGLHYRTKMRYAISDNGKIAMRKVRSNNLVEIDSCLLASKEIDRVTKDGWNPGDEITIVSATEETLVLTEKNNSPEISFKNRYGTWVAPAGEFWQIHKGAPELLIAEVLARLNPVAGDRIADLYAGVGLFSLPIANRVGKSGRVVAVEFDRRAYRSATNNLKPFPWAQAVNADVARYLTNAELVNKVVVDPPRSGLNSSVINHLTRMDGLTQICYVSCDVGTLARDLREFADLGWQIGEIQPMLLFPMTAHLETIVSVSKLS